MITYSKELAMHLTTYCAIAELLMREQRLYHREFINATQPDPGVCRVGDIVFARRTVWSVLHQEQVNKLQYPFTGPWQVTAVLFGASYSL